MKRLLLLALLSVSGFSHAAAVHPCAAQASQQAKKLLEFHFGADDRIAIDDKVTLLKPLKNPAGKGMYAVLEVYGYIYKGTYRMHFIYGQVQNECVLVGQEILEMTNL